MIELRMRVHDDTTVHLVMNATLAPNPRQIWIQKRSDQPFCFAHRNVGFDIDAPRNDIILIVTIDRPYTTAGGSVAIPDVNVIDIDHIAPVAHADPSPVDRKPPKPHILEPYATEDISPVSVGLPTPYVEIHLRGHGSEFKTAPGVRPPRIKPGSEIPWIHRPMHEVSKIGRFEVSLQTATDGVIRDSGHV
ncbi:MAG: hypothetical protein BWY82_02492 [Verrucomicrobia bacterium ADurb.Bin474]|nr:MAG: hypothetical protein BWY82_02492 [Verrucomicrobia bacterium ADurb.Bin474]